MRKEFLYELLNTPSVSGYEEEIQRKALEYSASYTDRQLTDATGNALHIINPDAERKVLLCGHIDEIGFVVTHIREDGMIQVNRVGGVRLELYIGSPVKILHEKGEVNGVMAVIPQDLKAGIKAEDLLIDIGAVGKEEAAQYVAVGDPVFADTTVRELKNDNISSRAMDNRTGAFVVLEAVRRAREKGAKAGVYGATTVGEETTMRGAYWASERVKPDLAIIVDVTYSSDCPSGDPAKTGEVSLGGGPVLCHSSIVRKGLNQKLKEISEKNNWKLQWEVEPGRTGTDGDMVHMTNSGIELVLVSIPLRYMHSSVEVGNLKDIEQCIELISEFLYEVEEKG